MRRITYLQGYRQDPVVLADVGMGAAALALPQDELTAVVRIAGILARNYGKRLPGEYWAVIARDDGAEPAVVTEDDPRVPLARDLLTGIARGREYTADDLGAVRRALLGSPTRSQER
jgi:hypothetical protein